MRPEGQPGSIRSAVLNKFPSKNASEADNLL